MNSIFQIDPLADARWPILLERSPHASLFHSPQWLSALKSTYGYLPIAYTTSPPGSPLQNGWVFCEIHSWITGRRLVSLPFSDHCNPILDNPSDSDEFAHTLIHAWQRERWKYVEFRPQYGSLGNVRGFELRKPFFLHTLDLSRPTGEIFNSLSKSSIQRKIRRAERDALCYEEGRSESLVDRFYFLFSRTRQRHGLPPPPRKWFSNLISAVQDQAVVRLASKGGEPVGATIMLRFKHVLVCKYCCGDPEHFKHGTMQLLLWRAIEDAKAKDLFELDFGRSDKEDTGLIEYKERWGAKRSRTGYFRFSPSHTPPPRWSAPLQNPSPIVSYIPTNVLQLTGRVLYRHFG